jgi:hypothetical protein
VRRETGQKPQKSARASFLAGRQLVVDYVLIISWPKHTLLQTKGNESKEEFFVGHTGRCMS